MQTPTNEAELAQMVAEAHGPLWVQGGGTRGVEAQGQLLSTAALSGVTLYEPGALTLVAQAGTPVAEIEAVLAAEGQRLAFEPMDHRGLMGTSGAPTIGGVFAGNISGPRRIQAGAARDFALGVRFVDGTGQVIRNGGRVMKNVTGYDLVKLMCGAWGTLGVLSEVSLKVMPVPEATGVVILPGLQVAEAVSAMSRALGSPFDVTGAAHAPVGPDGTAVTLIRVEGFADAVRYRCGALQTRLADLGDSHVEMDPDATARLWDWVRDAALFAGTDGDVWRVSCKPSAAAALAARMEAQDLLFDWGGGLIWARVPAGTDLRARLGSFDGHARLVRGTGQARFHPTSAPVAALSDALRRKFDPRQILNPGMMHAA